MSEPTALDALIAEPRLVEVDHVDVAASPEVVWEHVRHGDLGGSPPHPGALRLTDVSLPAHRPGR